MKSSLLYMRCALVTAIACLCLALGVGFFIEFYGGKTPCPLCFLQRLSMLGIAFSLYLNLVFKMRARHFGFALIWALLGLSASLRHIALNICKPLSSEGVFFGSYRLYTWSFLVFFLSILGIAGLLCFYKECLKEVVEKKRSILSGMATSFLFVMVLIGLFSVLRTEGWNF